MLKKNSSLGGIVLFLALLVSVTGCGSRGSSGTIGSGLINGTDPGKTGGTGVWAPGAPAKWNFLVYLDGDNNLEAAGIADLNEMEAVGSTAEVNILVLLDRAPGYDTSNGDWTGTRLYGVVRDDDQYNINSQVICDYGELDMSDPETLKDFIVYCQRNFPAEHTVLTLWNHGGGVYPRSIIAPTYEENMKFTGGTTNPLRGICWDSTSSSGVEDPAQEAWHCLTTDEVAAALAAAAGETGKRIDVINLDACLMQMIEVAYEWREQADFLVGSEENMPAAGNNYRTLLTRLTSNPDLSPQDLAANLVEDYYNHYSIYGSSTTYSALKLAGMNELFLKFQEFTEVLMGTDKAIITGAQAATTCFAGSNTEFRDLYDFLGEIQAGFADSDRKVYTKAGEVMTALQNIIILNKVTGGFTSFNWPAYGLSFLFPATADKWGRYKTNGYATLAFANSGWDKFLDYYFGL